MDRIHSGRFESNPGLPRGLTRGTFGADMQVFSQNDGPVTILFDTDHM
ncbi:D-aminoacyl-tRNA deacylase [Pseudoflavonifractor capillosus]